MQALNGASENEVLALAAALEQRSEHPLARAILAAAAKRSLATPAADNVRAVPGKGILGVVAGQRIAAGNSAPLQDLGISIPATAASDPGATMMYVVQGDALLGIIEARDTLRASASTAIAGLRRLGVRSAMLTGDTPATAEAIARAAGIDRVWAGLLPRPEARQDSRAPEPGSSCCYGRRWHQRRRGHLPGRRRLAMGTGADLTREAGDAILLHGEPRQILDAVLLAPNPPHHAPEPRLGLWL